MRTAKDSAGSKVSQVPTSQVTPDSGEALALVPSCIEGYEPLDMQEKYWALRSPKGLVGAHCRRFDRFGVVLRTSAAAVEEWLSRPGWLFDTSVCQIVEVTLASALEFCVQRGVDGVGISHDGFECIRFIEARPGER